MDKADAAAYIAGVVAGDGWLTHNDMGLAANDIEFVEAFRYAVEIVFGLHAQPRREGKRWRVRYRNVDNRFSGISGSIAMSESTRRMWLRGLFDGDGNAQCIKLKRGQSSYQRRIAIYKANDAIILTAEKLLADIGIETARSTRGPTTGHFGEKPVIELRVLRKPSMRRFVDLVGSSIPRKQQTLELIVSTMQPDGWQAENWKRAISARWPRERKADL